MANRGTLFLMGACAAFGLQGCFLFGIELEPNTDGEVCFRDGDCSSGHCRYDNLCAASSCSCEGAACTNEDGTGERSEDCRSGWVCKFFADNSSSWLDPDIWTDDSHTSCIPSCADGCPEHYQCGVQGDFCYPIEDWNLPVAELRWEGAAQGMLESAVVADIDVPHDEAILLGVSGFSPLDVDIDRFEWKVVHSSGDREELTGDSIEIALMADESYQRVDVQAIDALDHRGEVLSVTFWSCSVTGEACGYSGSGCCEGCDSSTDTCY